MVLIKNAFKKLIIALLVVILLIFFVMSPYADAKLKLEEGEFYYSGTTEGAYVVSEGVFSWLLRTIGDMADFLIGLLTMSGRMVFVGWTAIFEKLLTWVLESSTGIEMQPDKVNATDLKQTTDSSNNVTLEAIVYNQVPIFDVNFFEEDFKKCTSGTGRYFVKCPVCADPSDASGYCRMSECACEECKGVLEEYGYFDNAVTVIKKAVSEWYYIVRLAAMAAMLCVLIFVGIKLAISSTAQTKALYKNMLVDWIAGMILIFTIHYIMVAIIYINESFVEIIKGVETGVVEITKKEFNVQTKRFEDLEISIYEAVRTRAYDAKLINGTTGTFMYMTLVYYAFKFSIKYAKRYFTVIVLTVVSPIMAFAYAMQKALFGKGKSFTKWLGEYFIAVFIQTIHALIYTSFVSIALIISLNSVSGMIIAFVFMNFMDKAEPIFRKIFKLGGDGSLIEDVLKDENPLAAITMGKEILDTTKKLKDSKMIPEALKKYSLQNLATLPFRAAGMQTVLGVSKLKDIHDKKDSVIKKKEMKAKARSDAMVEISDTLSKMKGKTTERFNSFRNTFDTENDRVTLDEEDAIDEQLTALEEQAILENDEAMKAKLSEVRKKFDKVSKLTTLDVAKAQLSSMLDAKHYYDIANPSDDEIKEQMEKTGGAERRKRETEKRYNRRKEKAARKLTYKKKKLGLRYDEKTEKMVQEKMSDVIAKQFSADNIFGDQKSTVIEALGLFKSSLIGMGSIFLGAGMLIAEPGAGLSLLASGGLDVLTVKDKLGLLEPNDKLNLDVESKRFSNLRFSKGAKNSISKIVQERAEEEKDKLVVKNVKANHQRLYKALRLGGVGLAVLGTVVMPGISVPIASAGMTARFFGKNMGKLERYGKDSFMGRMNYKHFKEYNKAKKRFVTDTIKESTEDEKKEFKTGYNELLAMWALEDENIRNGQAEERKKELLRKGNAIQTKSGEIIFVRQGKLPEEKIVEQSVAEVVIRDVHSTNITMEYFKSEKVKDEIKSKIQDKLLAQDVEQEEIKIILESIDTKIEEAAVKIMREEYSGTSEEIEPVADSSYATEEMKPVANTSNVIKQREQIEHSSSEDAIDKLSILDQVLLEDIVRERAKKSQITDSILDTTAVVEEFLSRKEEMQKSQRRMYQNKSVIGEMQRQKGGSEEQQERLAVLFGADIKGAAGTSREREKSMQIVIEQMKKSVASTQVLSSEEKKSKFDKLLMDIVQDSNSSSQVAKRDVDARLESLFYTKEEREKAAAIMTNIRKMKRLNARAEGIEMSSSSASYRKAKEKQRLGVSYDTSSADRIFTGQDGSRRVEQIENYGPATDIVELIKKTTKNDTL